MSYNIWELIPPKQDGIKTEVRDRLFQGTLQAPFSLCLTSRKTFTSLVCNTIKGFSTHSFNPQWYMDAHALNCLL